jgi:hypothetical protein
MIELLIIIAIVGVVLWFVNQYVPMAPPFKVAINVIAAIALLLYCLQYFGITHFDIDHRHR